MIALLTDSQTEALERMIRKEFDEIDREDFLAPLQEEEVIKIASKLPVREKFLIEMKNDSKYAF